MSAMQASNRLRTALNQGRTSFGAWQMIPGANVSRLLARSGVDWVLVDCEHGNLDDGAMHDAVPAIAALGVSPIVRLPDMQGWMVKRALDSGAHGIVVPLLRTVEEARQLVQSAKFPPLGKRGFGSPIAPERFNPVPSFTEYLQQANDALLTIVQIETKEALECVDEIAAVEGIDVLFIGPFDLGESAPIPRSEPWIDVLTGNRKQHWASHHQRGHCTRAERCLGQSPICEQERRQEVRCLLYRWRSGEDVCGARF